MGHGMSEQTPERTTLTINWAQIAGGALAAVTSAFLLAGLKSLGSYGTLVGAAMGSVIASTAAAIYGHYLNASRQRLAEAARRARGRHPGPSPVPPAQDEHPDDPAPPVVDETDGPAPAPSPVPPSRKRFRPAHAVLLGVVAFVLSVGGIFAFEQLSGQSVAAERQGSTATVNPGVFGNEVTSTPSTPTGTPSPTGTATSTDTATATATASGSATATATDDPTSGSTATRSSSPTGGSSSTSSSASSSTSSSSGDATAQPDDAAAPTPTSGGSDAALAQPSGTPTTDPTAG